MTTVSYVILDYHMFYSISIINTHTHAHTHIYTHTQTHTHTHIRTHNQKYIINI